MQLDIYWTTLLVILTAVVLLTGRNVLIQPFARIGSRWRKVDNEEKPPQYDSLPPASDEADPGTTNGDDLKRFRRGFLSIYLLVMSSEWLSGPYLYALLRDDRGLPEPVVIGLYATVYTSAAVSALAVGFLADRYGRRKACLAQCVIHSLACLTVVSGGDCLPVLFLGRVLAGTALTLLWTVFESWMVTEWDARGLDRSAEEGGLSEMFGVMTRTNCMAAIVGGLFGHCMVSAMGSKTLPFWAGIVCEGVAAVLMLRRWNENFGVSQQLREDDHQLAAPDQSRTGPLGDGRIWALTFVTCCFEGTAYLVIFLWPSVLQGAHEASSADADPAEIPYGVIFGSFMAAMIIGALLFNTSLKFAKTPAAPVWLLLGAIALACLSLLLLSVLQVEVPLYYTFLAFEVANGIYVPSMAYMRGLVVQSKSRAGIYGLMKIPLFIFVILDLGITAQGKGFRCFVFASSAMSLLCAAIALLVELQGSLRGSDECVSQRVVERGHASREDVEFKEDEVDKQGEEGLAKGVDVSL
ncbi:major facilitator superfamily transporter [Diaporthe helianthi]|uniref:Molybdate-anion transporter n=1 Tax=Diaporthe helianthi TaxID=158607 RepID=A0A2P5HYZ5_DIAHE|nr:major facilitator superfamily transporter [Diaporthe helianthi]